MLCQNQMDARLLPRGCLFDDSFFFLDGDEEVDRSIPDGFDPTVRPMDFDEVNFISLLEAKVEARIAG